MEYDQSKKATQEGLVTLPLSPLMHGGAQASLLMHLFAGQLTILEPKFDPQRTWEWGFIERVSTGLSSMQSFDGDVVGRATQQPLVRKALARIHAGRRLRASKQCIHHEVHRFGAREEVQMRDAVAGQIPARSETADPRGRDVERARTIDARRRRSAPWHWSEW